MAQKNNKYSKDSYKFTEHDVLRGAASKYRRKRFSTSGVAIILCTVLFISVVAASVWHVVSMERPQKSRQEMLAESLIAENTVETEPAADFDIIEMKQTDTSRGDLILVNYEHKYVFPETEEHLINIFENKTNDYSVAYNDYVLDADVLESFSDFMAELSMITDDRSVLINSTYRSLEEQQSIYDSYVESNGEEYAEKYVADPGCSEHHTGLSLDLTIRFPDGTYELMKNYEHLDTLNTICVKHGFIQRYPENKFTYTHINTEPWHYRYVGVPHAYIICKQNFCLEEYIEFIKDYTTDTEMLLVGGDGEISVCDMRSLPESGYVVYYVAAGDGSDVSVPVPANADSYTISGDNCGGFVVAAKFGEPSLPEISFATPW